MWLYASQCHRQTLKYLKYWNSAGTKRTLHYRQVYVINKAFELFLLHKKCVEIVRVNLQTAVKLLSGYVRRLAAFEEILDKGVKMPIAMKRHFFSFFMWKTGGPDASEMATPKRVQTSRPKFAFSRMDNRKIKMDNKKKKV